LGSDCYDEVTTAGDYYDEVTTVDNDCDEVGDDYRRRLQQRTGDCRDNKDGNGSVK